MTYSKEQKKLKEARLILIEASAGLDINKPEYYEHQNFVVMPLKYFEKVCDLLLMAIEDTMWD